MRPTSSLEAKSKLASKRLWMLTTVTYVLVIVFTILAVVAYRYMDAKIRSDRHADYDQHN
jgi:uncharacterized membrane protein YjdF